MKTKDLHINLALNKNVKSEISNGLEKYKLEQDIPNFSFNEIDTSVNILRKKLSMPLFISPITGGGTLSYRINKNLAIAASKLNIGISLGSQKLYMKYPDKEEITKSYYVVKEVSEDLLLFANFGLVHLNYGYNKKDFLKACENLKADAIIFYINPLQEVFQNKGMINFSNILDKLSDFSKEIHYPIILKEIGFGFSKTSLKKIKEKALNIFAIDVAGRGGCDWSKIEGFINDRDYTIFSELGVQTAESIKNAVTIFKNIKVFASGGIRTGLDIAKSIALGADLTGMALPFLKWADESVEKIIFEVEKIKEELKVAMWYTNSKNINELKGKIANV